MSSQTGKKSTAKQLILSVMIKKPFKIMAYLLFFFFIIIVISAILLRNEKVQRYVKRKVQYTVKDNLNVKVDFSKFTLSFLPIGLNLNDVEVSPVEKATVSPSIKIKKVKIQTLVRPWKAFKYIMNYGHDDIIIKRVQFIGLNTNLYIKDGALTWPKPGESTEQPDDPQKDDAPDITPEEQEAHQKLIVRKIELRESDLQILDLDNDSSLKVKGINISLDTENIKEELVFFSKISSIALRYNGIDEHIRDILLDGKYLVEKERLKIKKARFYKGKSNELEASGSLFIKPKLTYDLDLFLSLGGKTIKRFLPESFQFVGTYKFTGKVSGVGDKLNVNGKVKSKKGNVYGIDFDSISLDVKVNNEGLKADNINAQIFGGNVKGYYHMPFSTIPDFKAKLDLFDVSMVEIENGSPNKPRLLGGTINGTLEGEGTFKGGYFIDINADLTSPKFTLFKELHLVSDKNDPRFIFNNMRLITHLDVSKRGLSFKKLSLKTDDFDLTVSGSMPEYTNFNLDFQTEVKDIGIARLPTGIEKELAGAVMAKGTLRNSVVNPTITMSLSAYDLLYDTFFIEKIKGNFSVKDKLLYFYNMSVHREGFDFFVIGNINPGKETMLALDIDVKNADISKANDLIEEFGVKRVEALDNMSGSFAGEAKLRGSAGALEVGFELYAPYFTLYGIETALDLEGSVHKDRVKITSASINKDKMTLNVDGEIVYSEGLDLDYKTSKLSVARILHLLKKDDIDFNANVISNGKLSGGFDDIQLASNVSLSDTAFKGQSLKDSSFNLTYKKNNASIKGDFFDDEIKLDLTLSGAEFNTIALKSSFDDFESKPLLSILKKKGLEGRINGDVVLAASLDYNNLSDINNYLRNISKFEAKLKVSDLVSDKHRFKETDVYLSYENSAGVAKLNILDDKIELMSNFEYDGDIDITTNININKLGISEIKKYFEEAKGLEGIADLNLYFRIDDVMSIKRAADVIANLRNINGAININDISYDNIYIGEFCLNLNTKDDILTLKGTCHRNLIKIDGIVNYKGKKDYTVVLTTTKIVNYPKLLKDFRVKFPEEIDGETRFDILISGNIDDYEKFNLKILSDLLTIKTNDLLFENDGDIEITFKGGSLVVDSFKLKEKNSDFSLSGSISKKKALDLKMGGNVNLLLVKPFLPKTIERFEGMTNLTMEIKGRTSAPELYGSFELTNSVVGVSGFPKNIENITGKGVFSQNKAIIENITGEVNGTPVYLSGDITKKEKEPVYLNLSLNYERLKLSYPRYVESESTSSLKLEGEFKDLTLSGTTDILKLEYSQPVEIIKLQDLFKRYKKRKSEPAQYKKEKVGLKFDITINAEDNIKIDNNIVKSELKSSLHLFGDASSPVITGNVEITYGKLVYLEKDFEIVSGIISFSNESYISPYFDITAEREIEPEGSDNFYVVTLQLIGEMENAKLYMESNPPLNKNDIAILILGIEPDLTDAEKAERQAVEGFGIASDIIQKEIEKELGKPPGFDTFRIDPYYSESSQGTSARLVVGKEISDDLEATYTTDVGGNDDQSAELEYSLGSNFFLLGDWKNQGSSSRGAFGGDIKFRFEFK